MSQLILIDADEIRANHLARRLRLRGLPCEVATSFLFALTTLEWQRPGLIVARAETIDGMTPTEFGSTIRHDSVSRTIPTVLVGSDGSAEAHFDNVVSETDTDRLASAIARIARDGVSSNATEATALPTSVPVPSQSIEETPDTSGARDDGHLDGFLVLLEEMSLGLKTGRIEARTESQAQPAFVLLDHGQMVHASFGRLEGPPAFRRIITAMIHQVDITYHFEPLERWQMGSYPRSIWRNERQRLLQFAKGQEWGTQELEAPFRFEAREG